MGFLFKYFSFAVTSNAWSYMTCPRLFLKSVWKAFLPLFPYVASRGHPMSSPAVLCVVASFLLSDSVWSHGLWPARLLCPWDSPGKNTGVGCNFLLQEIFLTQGLNLGLRQCRQIFVAGLKRASSALLYRTRVGWWECQSGFWIKFSWECWMQRGGAKGIHELQRGWRRIAQCIRSPDFFFLKKKKKKVIKTILVEQGKLV